MKKNKPYHKPMLALIKAHGDHNEVAFMKAAYALVDALEAEGSDTDELTHILGAHLAKTSKSHSMGQERACGVCGDIDGCHLWRLTER